MTSTQITNALGYNTSQMHFSKFETGSIPGSKMTYKRIKIGTKNEDGTIGDLILKTSELFSFGVHENRDMVSNKVNGYTLPLCMWNKNGASDEEKAWTDTFDSIIEKCKEHVVSVKDDIGQYELEIGDLKKFNPLYWKRENGKIVDGRGPTLYVKLISSSKKNNAIITIFTDANTGEDIDPMSLMKKYCYTENAIKIESIFIGTKISLQVKLYETVVRTLDSGMPKLISRPAPVKTTQVVEASSAKDGLFSQDDGSDDNASEDGSEDEAGDDISESEDEEERPSTPPPKKLVKKVVRRKKTTA